MSEHWYIFRQGKQYGPFNWDQIAFNYREGKIRGDDLLWSNSTGDWVRAESLKDLSAGTEHPQSEGKATSKARQQKNGAEISANYRVLGSVMPMVEIKLGNNERLYAQSGAMQWMDHNIKMDTEMKGGIFGALKRRVSGEDMFVQYFTGLTDGAIVAFGHTYPGNIIPLDISSQPIICQRRAFLCAFETVNYDVYFQKRLGAGFFGGEGFIMQKLSGYGTAFIEIDGECVEKELAAGEKISVETGSVGAFEESIDFNIERVKGVKNMFLGGEGMFLTTLTGPGKIWLQTMPIQNMTAEMSQYLPSGKGNK
ncbi:MAG: TIGR00266 family protein [Bacillota bacterium]